MKIILGNANSETEKYIVEQYVKKSLINIHEKHYIVVPDQFTQAIEELVLLVHERKAYINIEVLGFSKLCNEILIECLDNLGLVTELEQEIILRKILLSRDNEFEIFKGKYNKNGFIQEVKSIIMEAAKGDIDANMLIRASKQENLDESLMLKLKDISKVMQAYYDELGEKKLSRYKLINIAKDKLKEWKRLSNANFLFMGHQAFDVNQYKFLEALIQNTSSLEFFFSYPEDFVSGKMQSIFDIPKEAVGRICAFAENNQIAYEIIKAYKIKELQNKSIVHLKDNIFNMEAKQCEEVDLLELYVAKNIKAELINTTKRIKELVRSEGYCYDDFVVICSKLIDNEKIIKRIFEDADIPYFFDISKPIPTSPITNLIRAVNKIINFGPKMENIIAFIKCGFFSSDLDGIARLENEILKNGYRTYKAYKEWSDCGNEEVIKLFNCIEIIRAIKKASNLCDVTCVLTRRLLDYLDVEKQTKDIENKLLDEGDTELAQQYAQLYDMIIEILEALSLAFAGEKNTIIIWKILESLLGSIKLGVVSKKLDVVSIGDISRSILTKKKVAIIINANDGSLLNLVTPFALFSENQREALKMYDIDFGNITNSNELLNRLRLYNIFSKIEDRIIFSYSAVSLKGEALMPDAIIYKLREIFTAIKLNIIEDDIIYLPSTKKEILEKASTDSYNNPNLVMPLLALLKNDKSLRSRVELLYKAREKKEVSPILLPSTIDRLYNDKLVFSVSRLEKYNKCPFSYFLNYNLRLRERKLSDITVLDDGSLMHKVVERFFTEFKTDFDKIILDNHIIKSKVEGYIDEYISYNKAYTLTAQSDFKVRVLKDKMQRVIKAYVFQLSRGFFSVNNTEESFQLIRDIGDKRITLNGVIDRVDKANILFEGKHQDVYSIVDYKSSERKFDYTEFIEGISIQLPTYALGYESLGKQCIGFNYLEFISGWDKSAIDKFYLDEVEVDICKYDGVVLDSEEVLKAYEKDYLEKKNKLLKSNIFTNEKFDTLKKETGNIIDSTVSEILKGSIAIMPYKNKDTGSCKYCPYNIVCGFDKKSKEFDFRKLKDRSIGELLVDKGEKNELD